ncbi:hypothetical protein DM01DRAFT_253885 [Hesseltinella vesiculosa]|uniref:separase n=1 Tax=Hesseltinella vesiculosa TaxID=101127 RepID=A0A1X2GJX2_9FUNG|nr:hypothetical protein DM01DRAFT_253885 [Hesseltinella vesiculosa]
MRSYYNTLQGFYQQEHEYDEGEFQTQFINILPSPWTVCSLSFDPNTNALYVAQYRAGQPPLVVKLPIYRTMLQRQQALGITGGPTGLGFDEAIGEFQDIIQHSDHTIHTKKTSMTKKQIEDWWMTRSQLNTRMKKLLEQIESSWLGGFKGMLCGQFAVCKPLFEEFKIKVQHILAQHVKKSVVDLSDGLLHMILRLGLAPEIKDVNDVVYFLLSQPTDVKHTGAVQPYTNCPAAVVNQISQQLIDALKHYHDEALLRGIDTMQRIENSHVILIPDKHTQSLPLENLPIMRQQPTSRVPCLSFLRDRILYGHARANEQANEIKERSRQGKNITVQGSKTYYVLNPSGDLKHTQAEFQHTFATMPTWEGHVQKKPSELECRSVLKQKDIYM